MSELGLEAVGFESSSTSLPYADWSQGAIEMADLAPDAKVSWSNPVADPVFLRLDRVGRPDRKAGFG